MRPSLPQGQFSAIPGAESAHGGHALLDGSESLRRSFEEGALLYLHETVHVMPRKMGEYLSALEEQLLPLAQEWGLRMAGVWTTVESTGSADQVLQLWELDGWEHYTTLQRKLHSPVRPSNRRVSGEGHKPDEGLAGWRALMARLGARREGLVLLPSPRTPTLAQLQQRGVRGQLLLHERITTLPGKAEAYLSLSEEGWLPLAQERGFQWVGSYRVALKGTQAIELWLLRDWETFERAMASQAGHEAVQAWMREALAFRADWDDTLLVPARFSPLRG